MENFLFKKSSFILDLFYIKKSINKSSLLVERYSYQRFHSFLIFFQTYRYLVFLFPSLLQIAKFFFFFVQSYLQYQNVTIQHLFYWQFWNWIWLRNFSNLRKPDLILPTNKMRRLRLLFPPESTPHLISIS